MALDYPSIDVGKKTNEQNVQATKSWAVETVNQLTYQLGIINDQINSIESRLDTLESNVSELEEGGN